LIGIVFNPETGLIIVQKLNKTRLGKIIKMKLITMILGFAEHIKFVRLRDCEGASEC